MRIKNITPLILTFNEEANIRRTLLKLEWAEKIVVVDSGSTDQTLEFLNHRSGVQILSRPFDTFAAQRNYGLQKICTDWVLSLDADYVLSDDFVAAIPDLLNDPHIDVYSAPFRYCVSGHPIRSSLYPPRPVLFRKNKAHYVDDGHSERLEIHGRQQLISSIIFHDDRKPFCHWWNNQKKYTKLEAEKIFRTSWPHLKLQDQIRKLVVLAPLIVPLYCLFVKGGVLDGWRGWCYACQRFLTEMLLSLKLTKLRIESES